MHTFICDLLLLLLFSSIEIVWIDKAEHKYWFDHFCRIVCKPVFISEMQRMVFRLENGIIFNSLSNVHSTNNCTYTHTHIPLAPTVAQSFMCARGCVCANSTRIVRVYWFLFCQYEWNVLNNPFYTTFYATHTHTHSSIHSLIYISKPAKNKITQKKKQ